MASFKILLYKSKRSQRKDGSYPVCLRVTKNGKIKYISLNLHGQENQWDEGAGRYKSDKRLTPSYKEYNALLSRYEARVSMIISLNLINKDKRVFLSFHPISRHDT